MSSYDKRLPVVAIVGRPNVGKSSLFNRMVRKRIAVIHNEPGVTRDRHYAPLEWNGRTFLLVDTGGLLPSPRTEMELGVVRMVRDAIEQANVIVFVIEPDVHPDDDVVADLMRRTKKPVILVVNKVDNRFDNWSGAEAVRLGLGDLYRVSAKFGFGIGELLDAIVDALPDAPEAMEDESTVKIAVVGKPNVGKSSFVNKLLGKEVALVHHEPGTTRDAVNARFRYFGTEYEIVDTAGLFKKLRDREIEYYSALRTLRAIEESDVVLLVVDATEGFTRQDKRIASIVLERYRGLVIAMNKWDIVPEKTEKTMNEFLERIRIDAPFLNFVPIVFTSALTGQRVQKAMQVLHEVAEKMRKRVQTSKLNELVQFLQEEHPPPIYRGKRPKILYAVQTDVNPPEFVFFAKMAKEISPSYRRYISNRIREKFDFEGVPFKLVFRDRRK